MKRQRGFATIIIVVIAALAVAGVGYFMLSRTGAVPAIPGLAAVTFNDKCKHDDKELCKFLNNVGSLTDYTVTGTTTHQDETSGFTLKIDGDTRYQNTFSQGGKDTYDTIIIDKTTYTKDFTDNKWFKSTTTAEDESIREDVRVDDDPIESDPVQDPKYTKIASEACGKLTCLKYQVITPGVDGTEYLWFDTKEYKTRKVETTTADGAVTVMEYSYTNVNVSAPSPVKEGTPTSVVPDAATQAALEAAAAEAAAQMDIATEETTESE